MDARSMDEACTQAEQGRGIKEDQVWLRLFNNVLNVQCYPVSIGADRFYGNSGRSCRLGWGLLAPDPSFNQLSRLRRYAGN
jgi:hypothetical protein